MTCTHAWASRRLGVELELKSDAAGDRVEAFWPEICMTAAKLRSLVVEVLSFVQHVPPCAAVGGKTASGLRHEKHGMPWIESADLWPYWCRK